MTPVLYVLGLLAAWGAMAAMTVFARVRGLVLRRPTWRTCDAAEVPGWLVAHAAPAVERLESLGFLLRGALATRAVDRQVDAELYDLLLEHPETGAWAFVYALPVVPGARTLFVDFVTWHDAGVRMTVARSPGVVGPELTETELVALPSLSLGRRWARHCFETETRLHRPMAPPDIAADLSVRHGQPLEVLRAHGDVRPRPDGTFRYGLAAALRLTRTILAGVTGGERGRAPQAYHGWGPAERMGEVPPPALLALVHEELGRVNARRGDVALRSLVFAVTLVLFVLTLLHRLDAALLGALVAVLLLHELGHLAAMKLFGYRDASVYFLPFLGAATAGSKPEATLSERAVVLLAGPLPGLVLGLGLGAAHPLEAQPPALRVLTILLVVVNLLNLLPILPLDGGRLVERVLLSSHRGAEVFFKGASAALLLALGPWLGEWILAGVGLLIALSLPTTWRVSRALASFPDGPPTLTAIYTHLHARGLGGLPFRRQAALAREMDERLRAPRAAWGARALWLAAYLTALVGGIVAVGGVLA